MRVCGGTYLCRYVGCATHTVRLGGRVGVCWCIIYVGVCLCIYVGPTLWGVCVRPYLGCFCVDMCGVRICCCVYGVRRPPPHCAYLFVCVMWGVMIRSVSVCVGV